MTDPPMHINMDFIASGLVQTVLGLAFAAVLFGYAWWAPVVLAGAWPATHWFLRESAQRTLLHRLQYEATRLREKPLARSLLLVAAANVAVFWSLASAAASGGRDLGQVVVFAQVAVGACALGLGAIRCHCPPESRSR
jgi:hypothetical protein